VSWPWPGPGTASAAGTAPRAAVGNDWALVATIRAEISRLVRRSVARPSELAFYLCHAPWRAARRPDEGRGNPLVRGRVLPCRKERGGLDHYQVRLYKAWYRYLTLAMLALAWLAVTRAQLAEPSGPSTGSELLTSADEIRRMFTALCGPPPDHQHARHWSRGRHQHQERARDCRYQRQRLQDH
jgi:hypothetical protein